MRLIFKKYYHQGIAGRELHWRLVLFRLARSYRAEGRQPCVTGRDAVLAPFVQVGTSRADNIVMGGMRREDSQIIFEHEILKSFKLLSNFRCSASIANISIGISNIIKEGTTDLINSEKSGNIILKLNPLAIIEPVP